MSDMRDRLSRQRKLNRAVRRMADAFAELQRIRHELIALGSSKDMLGTKEGNIVLRLGQLPEKGKDAMKHDFVRITGEM